MPTVQASWDEGTGPPTPPSLPPGGRRVPVKVYDKLVKEFADLTIVQVRLRVRRAMLAKHRDCRK